MANGIFNRLNLNRLSDRFAYLIRQYLLERDLSQKELSDIVNMENTHLNNLLTGSRSLSANYLHPFLTKGIILVKDIYDNKPESDREIEFWKYAEQVQDKEMLDPLLEILKNGYSREEVIEILNAFKQVKKDSGIDLKNLLLSVVPKK